MEPSQKVTEQYQGPGRFTGAFGTSFLYGLIPNVATRVAMLSGARAGIVTVGWVTGLIASVTGLVVGWKNATKAEKDYEDVARRHNAAVDNVAALSASSTELAGQLATQKRHFTEMVEAHRGTLREHGDHATKEAHHTSHAEKHAAEKEAAANAQMAV